MSTLRQPSDLQVLRMAWLSARLTDEQREECDTMLAMLDAAGRTDPEEVLQMCEEAAGRALLDTVGGLSPGEFTAICDKLGIELLRRGMLRERLVRRRVLTLA